MFFYCDFNERKKNEKGKTKGRLDANLCFWQTTWPGLYACAIRGERGRRKINSPCLVIKSCHRFTQKKRLCIAAGQCCLRGGPRHVRARGLGGGEIGEIGHQQEETGYTAGEIRSTSPTLYRTLSSVLGLIYTNVSHGRHGYLTKRASDVYARISSR